MADGIGLACGGEAGIIAALPSERSTMSCEVPPAPAVTLAASDLRTLVVSLVPLTPRQLEVAWCLAEGHTRESIAHILGLSASTVEKHLRVIYDRLGVDSAHAAATAIHHAIEAHLRTELARALAELAMAHTALGAR